MKTSLSFRPLSVVKNLVVSHGRAPRRAPSGLYKGITMEFDMRSETQLYLGLAERETHPFIRAIAKDVAWFVDIGAGKGELCLYFLKQPGRKAVIAADPDGREIEALVRNLRLNGYAASDLTVLTTAVGTGDGAVALDRLAVDRGLRGFVKIDVEGAEMDVLESGVELLDQGQVDLLIETHSAALEEACISWLRLRRYTTTVIRNAWWRTLVPDFRPIEHNRWLWATRSA